MAPLNTANPALALLLQRRSHHRLATPGPDDLELAQILQAALRVPDFGHLRPYRFMVARGSGLDRLGAAMERAAAAAGKPAETVARSRRLPRRAPLVIVAVATPRPDKTVPRFDQELCAGATVLTMQLAARALGYSGIWRSGWLMYDRGLHRELGLGADDQIVGFLYLGKPAVEAEPEAPATPAPDHLVTWI